MSEVIKELEHVLKVVENDLEYYENKVKLSIKNNQIPQSDFYRGGKEALKDVKSYLTKEIKRTKITNKFEKNEKVS